MTKPKRRGMGLEVLVSLAGLTAAGGAYGFARILGADGWGPADGLLLLLFIILYFWISLGFWIATFGFVRDLFYGDAPALHDPRQLPAGAATSLPATAILMPIHDEDPASVFAALRAIRADLNTTGHSGAFHVFVLSDTRDPEVWAAEEWAWLQARATAEGQNLFYRRRAENVDRKSGNIQDFCERWGSQYRYMIVLDADSLMSGETLVEMVRRMEDDPEVGILQVPPVLVNRDSLFGRMLQFSSALYGRIFCAGFSTWAESEGNYWGHNSILRSEPFMQHCGLPHLPGAPPWGGEILSHDFVEAALMLRAGWKVVLAADLRGSYEECPSNLIDFAKRDERWSRGNLQHIPLTVAEGMHPASRLHMAMGVLSYLASSLWALFMALALVQGVGWHRIAGTAGAGPDAPVPFAVALAPLIGALVLLLMVKVWSLLSALLRPSRAARFGTRTGLTGSVLLETLISFLLAPILMVYHTTFVINTFLGRKVGWEAQNRGEQGISPGEAFRVHSPHTIAGLVTAWLASWAVGGLYWWLLPIWLGLIFSAPLALLLGSTQLGRRLRAAGLFLIPEEIEPPAVLQFQRAFLAEGASDFASVHPMVRLVADPAFLRAHLALLPDPASPAMELSLRTRLQQIALSGGPTHVRRAERLLLMQDPEALRWLHREAWKDWPIELLQKVASTACQPCASKQPAAADHGSPA